MKPQLCSLDLTSTGLRVTQVDPEKQQLAVSMRPGASDYTVGDEVSGKVPFGTWIPRFFLQYI